MDHTTYCKTTFLKRMKMLATANAVIFLCSVLMTVISLYNMSNMLSEQNYFYFSVINPPIALIISIPLMIFSFFIIIYTKRLREDVCPSIVGFDSSFFG